MRAESLAEMKWNVACLSLTHRTQTLLKKKYIYMYRTCASALKPAHEAHVSVAPAACCCCCYDVSLKVDGEAQKVTADSANQALTLPQPQFPRVERSSRSSVSGFDLQNLNLPIL